MPKRLRLDFYSARLDRALYSAIPNTSRNFNIMNAFFPIIALTLICVATGWAQTRHTGELNGAAFIVDVPAEPTGDVLFIARGFRPAFFPVSAVYEVGTNFYQRATNKRLAKRPTPQSPITLTVRAMLMRTARNASRPCGHSFGGRRAMPLIRSRTLPS